MAKVKNFKTVFPAVSVPLMMTIQLMNRSFVPTFVG